MIDEKKTSKPGLAVMLALKTKKKAMEGDGSMYEDIAGDVLDAVKGGDAAALAESLKAFVESCLAKRGGGSEEAEESESEY